MNLGNIFGRKRTGPEPQNNFAQPPLDMLMAQLSAAVTNYFKGVTDSMANIENPSDYFTQVKRCREIWSGKYSDPLVSSVMDMCVQAVVDFGAETVLSDVDFDHPAKKIVDHWCANVNGGMPMITKGLDAARKAMHRKRWRDGGVVLAWSTPESMQTEAGLEYKAPKKLAMLPRPMFRTVGSKEFGGFRLIYKSDLQEQHQEHDYSWQEDVKTGGVDDFLSQARYQVLDRARDEDSQLYPIPFLAVRGLTGICARIRAQQRGDYQTVRRIMRAILLITQGSTDWIEAFDWNPTEDDFETLAKSFSTGPSATGDHDYVNVFAAPYTTEIDWKVPPLEGMLSQEKYLQDNMERLAGLGIFEILGTGQRRRYAYNPKPLIMEMYDAMQEDRRVVEGVLFPLLWEANPAIFRGVSLANFSQKRMTLFLEEAEKQIIVDLFKLGAFGWGTLLEQAVGFGADVDAEYHRRLYEQKSDFESVFIPPIAFTQTVRESPTPKGEASLKAQLAEPYEDLKFQLREVAHEDLDLEEKKRAMRYIVTGAFVAFALRLSTSLRDYYSDQFEDSTKALEKFQPYISTTAEDLKKLGNDLLSGGAGGTVGLYRAAEASEEEVDALIDRAMASNLYRLSMYERDPFYVAKLSAGAAKAIDGGMKYAVRHSAFEPTTCQECIQRHGEVIPINKIFAGNWDHPHGICYFTYHVSKVAASLEADEMLSITEINAIWEEMPDMEDFLE